MRAIDVHGFGGGFTLGAVQTGWELVAKMSFEKGFGVYNTLGNRHLLGYGWDSITANKNEQNEPPDGWPVMEAELVFGNPPCSGFSTLTSSPNAKGIHAPINECMWQVVRYGAKVAPPIIMWESVQQTFRQGMELMRALHADLEERTGLKYTLYHVLHNNASVGGCAIRRRYFWVASRVPFGVDHGGILPSGERYDITRVPTLGEVFQDLEPLGMSMATQPFRGVMCDCRPTERYATTEDMGCRCSMDKKVKVLNASWWARQEMHDGSGLVDGHKVFYSPSLRRMLDLMWQPDNEQGVPWEQGERLADVLRKYYERHNELPPSWRYKSGDSTKDKILIESDFLLGHHQQVRWRADRMARVVTGGAVHSVVHPTQPRTLTQREVARIQGFPDAWKIWPVRNAPDLGPGWGKGVPVQAGRWGAYWARESIEGRPGPLQGVPLVEYDKKLGKKYGHQDREFVIDISNDYKPHAMAIGDPG